MTSAIDLWNSFQPEMPSDLEEAGVAIEVKCYFGGPRDIEIAREFLRQNLPGGRIYIYGAGTHTDAIFDLIEARSDIEVLGFLDRQAAHHARYHGHEVLPPEAIQDRDYDYILLSYNRIEQKLADRLTDLGVPQSKIFCIYSNPRFIEAAVNAHFAPLHAQIAGRTFDSVIVWTGFYEIIPERLLAKIFPPERTLSILIGPSHPHIDHGRFPLLEVQQSIALMARVLEEVKPKIVYMSTAHEFDLSVFAVKAAVPEARIIHEVYDFFNLIPDDWVMLGIDASPRLLALMRAANHYSTQCCDLVISKRSGRSWTPIESTFKSEYRFVFPGVDACPPGELVEINPPDRRPTAGEPFRLLYGGALVPPHFDIYKRSDYNFLPLMEALTDGQHVVIDVYNSSHREKTADKIFREYMNRYPGPGLTYRRGISLTDFMELMPDYHYGWLCLPPRERELPDQHVVICNRFSTYIFGGLPVLIDAEWVFIAELVEAFDAGIVLREVTPASVLDALRANVGNNDRHRQGARRLSEHMQAHNFELIRRLREVVQEAGVGLSPFP